MKRSPVGGREPADRISRDDEIIRGRHESDDRTLQLVIEIRASGFSTCSRSR